jgi:outer membrane cobalamin receptor
LRTALSVYVTLSLLYASFALAQQSSTSAVSQAGPGVQQNAPDLQQNVPVLAPPRPDVLQNIRVTTTVEPLPLAESDRSVKVLSPSEIPDENDSVVDLLRVDPSLNVQARAGEGVQADLSLRGTTFEQSLILVNGLRVNDPETGHLNLDIPVPLVKKWILKRQRRIFRT